MMKFRSNLWGFLLFVILGTPIHTIAQADGVSSPLKQFQFIHPHWTDTVTLTKDQIVRLSNGESAKILYQSPTSLTVQWPNFGMETFNKSTSGLFTWAPLSKDVTTDYHPIHIPKIIHYVWLGSAELPENVQQAIATWKKHMPDWTIKRWDEHNCDITANPYIRGAYQAKKYDFASDWCRVLALSEGGVYLDTDMFLNASLEPLLDEPLVLTLQQKSFISASFMAVIPNHPFVKALKENYEKRSSFDQKNAPTTWSFTFSNLTKRWPIMTGRWQKEVHIYPPNILMYDFKGGENIAEHMFGNGSPIGKKSPWYSAFRASFLGQYAFRLPKKYGYFIPKTPNTGYFSGVPLKEVQYTYRNNQLAIYTPRGNLLLECQDQTCHSIATDAVQLNASLSQWFQ